ncbi:uncharacterized protein LOC110848414 [Folsomia candida]|uniref:Uncharacterized protein n=1 Tax=Folsomia candida TaxID=158441 RepID=A0A226EE60_FOLCA|nr:uncharacterized protein LOC110848414 [Folsomia candida]OXA55903.1 hypothetical protein Fcan01_08649 [Folsomia candida]
MQIFTDTLIAELCSCTDICTSSPLLTELQISGIITEVLVSKIESDSDPKRRALRLYTFLKNNAVDEALPTVKEALKKSANTKALRALESAISQQSDQSNVSASVGTNAAPSATNEPTPTLITGDVKVSDIASILNTSDEIIENLTTFYPRFPKVRLSDMKQFLDKFNNGSTNSRDVIRKVLTSWKGKNGNNATVAGLITILEKEDADGLCFMEAAKSLRKKYNLDCSILDG